MRETLLPPKSHTKIPFSVSFRLWQDEDEFDKDEDQERSPDDCHVIPNDKSTEFILATVVEEEAAR